MFNFLAGSVVQLALLAVFDHKSDAIIIGGLLVVFLAVRMIIMFGRKINVEETEIVKGDSKSAKQIKRRVLL